MSEVNGRQMLEELSTLTRGAAEDDFNLRSYLPHCQRAVENNVLLVLGERGSGKSCFFQALIQLHDSERVAALFRRPLSDGTWMDAFSEGRFHPDIGLIEQFAANWADVELRSFWVAHLARRLHQELKPPIELPEALVGPDWYAHDHWMKAAPAVLGPAFAFLDHTETWLASQQRQAIALYDHLDRIAPGSTQLRRRCVGSLLGLWLTLDRRFKWIRGKLFLRQDIFSQVEGGNPDLSKLRSKSLNLEWNEPALYTLLLRRLDALPNFHNWLQNIPSGPLQKFRPKSMPVTP